MLVTDVLVEYFPKIMDFKFTAHMEDELDEIATAKVDMVKVLDEFYHPFQEDLEAGDGEHAEGVGPVVGDLQRVRLADGGQVQQDRPVPRLLQVPRVQGHPADGRLGPARGRGDRTHLRQVRQALMLRESKRGPFLSCSGYPGCKESYNLDPVTATSRSPRWSRPSTSATSAASRWPCGKGREGPSSAAPATRSAGTPCPSTTQGKPVVPVKVDVKCEKCGGPMGVQVKAVEAPSSAA